MTAFFAKHRKKFIYALTAGGLVITLILANLLSSFIVPTQGESQQISSTPFTLHLISLAKSKVNKEAEEHSKDFQVIGAGGYVWEHDEYYHIITSGYLNKTDAQLVQNNIKINLSLDSQLISVDFPSYIIYGTFDTDETKALDDLLAAPLQFYSSIYDISISLDTGVFNETAAKLNVNTALNDYSKALADFGTLFSQPLPDNLSPIYEMSLTGYGIAQKLSMCEKTHDQQTYSSLLKYRYLEMMELFYHFVSE